MRINPPDAYWKKDVVAFFGRRFALIIKMIYPIALIVPVSVSSIPPEFAAAVVGIVAIMAGTFGAGETLTTDLNDGILMRVALTPVRPQRIVFEVLAVNAVLDFLQLLPPLLIVFLVQGTAPVWALAAAFGVFMTLVAANCIGIFIANFTTSPADVLLYATAILFPLIYVSGFFRNRNPEGVLAVLRDFVPFAYMNDALQAAFGLATSTPVAAIFIFPTLICAVMAAAVCLTGPRLLSPRM
ncbi:ABC transporter permease [Rubrobacter aplysinae]|uniref:ABC transporter permease n=1 Tax=Rubrobacter aplysinae TaxID=909625 RepID=UPI00064BC4FD|nr:ABC transporter permease [Rubrobacter aplysinae]